METQHTRWKSVQEMLVLLHHSGLFLEILIKHSDVDLSDEEKDALDSICLNMKFALQCKYKLAVGDVTIQEGTTGNMFGGEKKLFVKGTTIIREIMKGRDGLY